MLKEYDALSNYYNLYECNSAAMLQCSAESEHVFLRENAQHGLVAAAVTAADTSWIDLRQSLEAPPPSPTYC